MWARETDSGRVEALGLRHPLGSHSVQAASTGARAPVEANGSADDGLQWEALPDESPDALGLVELEEQHRWLDSCIALLPPEQREVLLLRHEGELTFREIAELTGCSINTALGRMRYALTNLRRIATRSRDGLVRAE